MTVHDLQYLTFPEHFSRARLAYLRARMPPSVRGAAVVVTPSQYVRATVIDAFDVLPDRVVVVHHGVEAAVTRDVTPEDVLRRRYALGDGPVITYPAMTHPHKNHEFLLRVMAERWTDPELRLVLIGGQGSAEHVVTASLDGRVCRLGRVPDADRNGLIAMSRAVVFPSSYEGFGAPVIEAQALGTPVIASDAASLPEIVSLGGLSLPLDVDAWAGALDEVERRLDELVHEGRLAVASFGTATSGLHLLQAYEKALA